MKTYKVEPIFSVDDKNQMGVMRVHRQDPYSYIVMMTNVH